MKKVELTQDEKLEALVNKAFENGWHGSVVSPDIEFFPEHWIFQHKFAKALFGEELGPWKKYAHCEHRKTAWRYFLQEAVISEDPIGYFYEMVFGGDK